ncbi:MAG TPA: aldo/keto reductase, partial [Pricia sp.]|nr:aldo/keto reductase [Pricia sp.]
RYSGETASKAIDKYHQLAKAHGLSMTQMALAFVNTRPFVTSTIIGATSMEQLTTNIASIDVNLSAEVLEGIEDIHNAIPNPAP